MHLWKNDFTFALRKLIDIHLLIFIKNITSCSYILLKTKIMKAYRIGCLLLLIFLLTKSQGQISAITNKMSKTDTLKTNSLFLNVDLLFNISNDEMTQYVDYKLIHSLRLNYLFVHTDVDVIFRQILEREDNGSFYYSNFLMLSSGIYQYKHLDNQKAIPRKIYAEPLFIFQNHSDRGLQYRFQVGALLHPWSFVEKKVKFNLGVGIVYDWSSWSVNDAKKISNSPIELQEKIGFINSHIKMRKNLYQDHNEFRPMILLNLNYDINNILNIYLAAAAQQSLSSPYNKEIQKQYPDLKKVYPYIISQLDINVKIYKGIALRASARIDYENNNLSLYDSSWEYNILFGGSWTFSGQKAN